jgi:hypothetical protein
MAMANEIGWEARTIENGPAPAPGSQPAPIVVAELLRNLASVVAELAEWVEEIGFRA